MDFQKGVKNWNCKYKNFDESLIHIYCSLETLTEHMGFQSSHYFYKELGPSLDLILKPMKRCRVIWGYF